MREKRMKYQENINKAIYKAENALPHNQSVWNHHLTQKDIFIAGRQVAGQQAIENHRIRKHVFIAWTLLMLTSLNCAINIYQHKEPLANDRAGITVTSTPIP